MVRPRPLTYLSHFIAFGLIARPKLLPQHEVEPHVGVIGAFDSDVIGWETVDFSPDGYLLGLYRIATAPEPNSSRLTSFKSIRFDSPANNVGPCPASLGCTTNSYSSINPNSANASGSFTPPTNNPLPDSRFSC